MQEPHATYICGFASRNQIASLLAIPEKVATYMKAIVCVIDGDPAVRDSLKTLMSLSGHDVATYATGKAFLNELDQRKLQCVVCEAQLPDTTGFTIFKTLRKRNIAVPFALLVSRNDRAIYDEAQRNGIAHVFTKPLVNRALTAFVQSACYGRDKSA